MSLLLKLLLTCLLLYGFWGTMLYSLFQAFCAHHLFNFDWWEHASVIANTGAFAGQRREPCSGEGGLWHTTLPCSQKVSWPGPAGFVCKSSHCCLQWTLLNYASSYWRMLSFKTDGCLRLQGSAIILFTSLSLSLASCLILILVNCFSASTNCKSLQCLVLFLVVWKMWLLSEYFRVFSEYTTYTMKCQKARMHRDGWSIFR